MKLRILFLVMLMSLALVLPAVAAGFSYVQFATLVLVNLALGAVAALFVGVLLSAVWHKFKKPVKVVLRTERAKSRS